MPAEPVKGIRPGAWAVIADAERRPRTCGAILVTGAASALAGIRRSGRGHRLRRAIRAWPRIIHHDPDAAIVLTGIVRGKTLAARTATCTRRAPQGACCDAAARTADCTLPIRRWWRQWRGFDQLACGRGLVEPPGPRIERAIGAHPQHVVDRAPAGVEHAGRRRYRAWLARWLRRCRRQQLRRALARNRAGRCRPLAGIAGQRGRWAVVRRRRQC